MDTKSPLCCLPFVLAGLPGLAADQEPATSAGGSYIEEIIVTAEKREERLLDVPLTMSAFSEQMIEELGMTNANDIEQLVPGLQFGDNGEQVGQGTVIRGIGSRLAGETHSDLAVATYVDGVYTIGTYGVAPNLFDVERIEVARGPQGDTERAKLDRRFDQLLHQAAHRRVGLAVPGGIHRPDDPALQRGFRRAARGQL